MTKICSQTVAQNTATCGNPTMQCVYSNDLNTLVETVARVLSAESFTSPLTPDWLIVPNQDTGRWLQLQLTDRLGCLANTKTTTLPNFVQEITGTKPSVKFEAQLYWAIATVWQQKNPDLGYADYLQQVKTLVELFQRYLTDRPDWLSRWESSISAGTQKMKWQQELWLEIQPLLGDAPHDALLGSLSETNPLDLGSVGRVIVFNPDRLSSIHLRALQVWTSNNPCFVCVQSPSPEPWFTEGSLELPETHPILADLCREKAKVFSIIGDQNFIDGFKRPEARDALSQLKAALYHNQAEAIEIDDSIEFVAATSPTQEVISLKKRLTQWINSDPTNSLRDVQIVTPNPGLYGPIVQRIFHAPERDRCLPTSPDPLLTRPLESVAIDLFAQSYTTGFKAGSLYTFLTEQSVRDTLRLSDHHLRQIQTWLVNSGARRGLRGHRHTLREAKKRLLRGLLADRDANPSVNSTATEALEQTFSIDRLIACLSALNIILSAPDQIELRQALELIDDAISRLTLDQVRGLNLAPLTHDFSARKVHLGAVLQWIQSHQDTGLSRPLALNDQLSVTAPQTIRSVQTKVVAILGANHDTFPKDTPDHAWDLVAQQPRPGDSIISENDRQVLADIVLNTDERLWISWIGRHPTLQTKELPGPGVITLLDCFEKTCDPVKELPMGIPLQKPFSEDEAVDEVNAQDRQLQWSVSEFLVSATRPAHAFLEYHGARLTNRELPSLDLEPLEISPLNAFKLREGLILGRSDHGDLADYLRYHPEFPDELDLEALVDAHAPELVREAIAIPSETVTPGVLQIGTYELMIENMHTVESPRILIRDKIEGAQGLRMLLEGLILYAKEQTDDTMRIVTFSNRVSPFGPIAKDEAQTILHQWFDVVSDRNSPCPLITPLAFKTAGAVNRNTEYVEWINWRDKSLRFYPEYERLFFNDTEVSQKHSTLVKTLVVPLRKYLGKARESL